jgi:DNA-binding Lrp family transcriptional regulator
VTRRIAALEASTTLTYDVDVLPERLGFAVHAMVWMRMPPRHVPEVAQKLLSHREIASVIAVSGPNNLMAVVIARDVDDLYRYLTAKLGTVHRIESYGVSVRTRRVKQAGSLVSHGRLI